MHPDGYIEIKDRSKDIIISGGENISSLEIEETLYRHPQILEAAVVARPDEKWGNPMRLCHPQGLERGNQCRGDYQFCRDTWRITKLQKPWSSELPKTSTGKIQKHVLREKAQAL